MSDGPVIVDAGPLVALLDRRDAHHEWAVRQFDAYSEPFLTCEAVLTETFFLTSRLNHGSERFFQLLGGGVIRVALELMSERVALASLVAKYADVPMSLADACLVRMVELTPDARVMTLDSDFRIYRQHGRRQIRLIMPDEL